jgi:hypothetical protein
MNGQTKKINKNILTFNLKKKRKEIEMFNVLDLVVNVLLKANKFSNN